MKCYECGEGDLVPTRFLFERLVPNGLIVHRDVDGFQCSRCADRVLTGEDAEGISREWYLAARAMITAPSVFVETMFQGGDVVNTGTALQGINTATMTTSCAYLDAA